MKAPSGSGREAICCDQLWRVENKRKEEHRKMDQKTKAKTQTTDEKRQKRVPAYNKCTESERQESREE